MTQIPTRFDPETSYAIEGLALRGWPADEVEEVEGWILRRTEAVDRRRSNSMLPPADPAQAARTVDLALATAEELGFAPVIQVSPAEAHLRLDDALQARGMVFSGASLVLAGTPRADGARAARGGVGVGGVGVGGVDVGGVGVGGADVGGVGVNGVDVVGGVDVGTVALGPLTHEWVAAWEVVAGIEGTRETAELVLSQLGERARFATASDPASGAPIGVGIGVAEQGWLGLFSLAVAAGRRRSGIASRIVDALESWATTAGARHVYLQVEADNAAALAFYARRGFHVAHSYHYRSA